MPDDKLNVSKVMISLFGRVENTVGKEKMLVTSIFSSSRSAFQSLIFKVIKSRDCVVKSSLPAVLSKALIFRVVKIGIVW